MSRPRIVALTTDFGLEDVYVGVVRGVIKTLSPEAEVIDICHAVRPGDLHEGAFMLLSSVPFLPRGTIHVCVVDPGVGMARRIVAVRAGGHTLIAPDNGVLAPVVEALGGASEARCLTNDRLQRPQRGSTFQGRDVMAPVAAHLVRGIDFALVGEPAGALADLPGFAPTVGADAVSGRVLHVDRFGNVVTNFVAGDLGGRPEDWTIEVGSGTAGAWARTYADVGPGAALAYVGSVGFIEVAVRDGHAARLYGVGPGVSATARRRVG